VTQIQDQGAPKYPFNEIAFAIAPERLRLTWKTFKQQNELDQDFLCIRDEADTGAGSEGFDYGSISIGDLKLRPGDDVDLGSTVDLLQIGRAISPKLADILESMHTEGPSDGYRPIGWHNVFWVIGEKYCMLFLMLDEREPFCETVQALAEHISSSYQEVKSVSRPTISRRRTRLYDACEQLVHEKVFQYLGTTA
jgi:hypothetical protein